MVNGALETKHHYNVPWVIFAVVMTGVIVAFLYWKYQVPADRALEQYLESQATEEAASEGRDPVASPVRDASAGASAVTAPEVPSVNPVERVNPFENVNTNPFNF